MIRDNYLSEEEQNRYLISELVEVGRTDMTYIIGARCKDGVVLVGDRKVTLESGTDFDFEDKIFMDVSNIIVGSSGVSGLFDKFRSRVSAYVVAHPQGTDIQTFISEIETITRTLNQTYRETLRGQTFDVLLGFRLPQISALQYIYPIGFAEGVRKYKAIGHGEPYGSIFLKRLWDKELTMAKFAELGYFTIRQIEELKLDSSVGGIPQIWYIPDPPRGQVAEQDKAKYEVHQVDQRTIDEFEQRTLERIDKYKENIKQLFP